MEIKTKFNLGDIVYYFDKNKIKEGKVDSVGISGFVSTEKSIMNISYTLYADNEGFKIKNEDQVFLNHASAIKNLLPNMIDIKDKKIVSTLKKEVEKLSK